MAKIKIAVRGNRAALLGSIDLIAGTVGQKCEFYFDEEWLPLNKTVTYKVGPTVLASEELKGTEITIPQNVLATAGLPLEIGITGYVPDMTTVMPTSWCRLGCIQNGAVFTVKNPNEDGDKHIIYDGGVIL